MLQQFPGTTKKAPLWGAFFVWAMMGGAPVWASCALPASLREVQVARVVDGDTLRLADGRSVRLIGLNAPELAHDGRAAEPLAAAAAQRLQQLVEAAGGRVALLVGEQAADRYGRTLAYAFGRDGRNWTAQLLEEGLGFAVAIAPNTALADCQFAAERAARTAGRGVWRLAPPLAAGQLRGAGFALLRGRVASVERNRGGVWLALGGSLVLRVAPQWLARFDGRDWAALEGREVEVRGWVVDRGRLSARARWLLELSHPAMLQVR